MLRRSGESATESGHSARQGGLWSDQLNSTIEVSFLEAVRLTHRCAERANHGLLSIQARRNHPRIGSHHWSRMRRACPEGGNKRRFSAVHLTGLNLGRPATSGFYWLARGSFFCSIPQSGKDRRTKMSLLRWLGQLHPRIRTFPQGGRDGADGVLTKHSVGVDYFRLLQIAVHRAPLPPRGIFSCRQQRVRLC